MIAIISHRDANGVQRVGGTRISLDSVVIGFQPEPIDEKSTKLHRICASTVCSTPIAFI